MIDEKTASKIVSKADSPASIVLLGASLFAGAYLAYRATRPSAPTSEALQRVRHTLSDARGEVSELAQRKVEKARHTGSDVARQALSDVAEAGRSLQDQVSQRTERRKSAGIDPNIQKALAVFSATLLAKSLSGYMRWRSEVSARKQAERQQGNADAVEHSDSAEKTLSPEEVLQEHTVIELRKMAADQDIEGRSSMRKDDLVEALVDEVANDSGDTDLKN